MLNFFEKRGYIGKKENFYLYNNMHKPLKVVTEQEIIVEYIQTHLDEETIVFITGVGKNF